MSTREPPIFSRNSARKVGRKFLEREKFRGADVSAISSFVASWERDYRDAVSVSATNKQPIDYFAELNLLGDLTVENVTRLLRWKDTRMLTHPRLVEGTPVANPRVVRVLNRCEILNAFRRGDLDEDSFAQVTREIFPQGPIWQQFLFHLARPWEWPIADQHVLRAYAALFDVRIQRTPAGFRRYRDSFMNLARCLSPGTADGADRTATVISHKRLDSALMAYGQFLRTYDR